jgi:hypothetical protein
MKGSRTLSRPGPAALNESEIAVASKEGLHAVPLSGKRLLAMGNALLGVEERNKIGERAALIAVKDRLNLYKCIRC